MPLNEIVLMYPTPARLSCYHYVKEMGGGATVPYLVLARTPEGETARVVIKLRQPGTRGGHHDGTSIVCELVFAMIARTLELPVPDFAIVNVGAVFVGGISEEGPYRRFSANVGENFGSLLLEQRMPWDPACARLSFELRALMAHVLTFDATIVNGDRTRGKPNLLWDGKDGVHVIDHGLACPVYRWPPEMEAGFTTMPEGHIVDHCSFRYLSSQGSAFDVLLSRWQTQLTPAFWAHVRGQIPSHWETSPGDTDRILGFLEARSTAFAAIANDLKRIVR